MNSPNSSVAVGVRMGALAFLATMAITYVVLDLATADLRVPFKYSGDALWFLVPIKAMVEHGWPYEVPRLSAPYGLSVIAFPAVTHFDWLLAKVIAIVATGPGMVLNLFWVISMALTAWTTTVALHLLGLRPALAGALGVIYALLPFALLRNVSHIILTYYCLPLEMLLAFHLAGGRKLLATRTARILVYGAVIAQGLNYIYFSFFSALLLGFSGWLGCIKERSWLPLRQATAACALMALAASINLVPSFMSWHVLGKPPGMEYKSAREAEVYGLKIRKMLAPSAENETPVFREWARRDQLAQFPNENENTTARLGPMASLGLIFLLMLAVGAVRVPAGADADMIRVAAALGLFSLLFATVGGFGAIFNLIVPDIRAYNRFSVFIAFFALVGIGLWWESAVHSSSARGKRLLYLGLAVVGSYSLYDQTLEARHLRNLRPTNELEARSDGEFIGQLEAAVPPGTWVYQLPISGFPVDPGRERMMAYDHARPYLWSYSLKWSWPSFSQQHNAWQESLERLEGVELLESLALSGFGLIWVDRLGYADNGRAIVSSLTGAGARELFPGRNSRYAVLDVSDTARKLRDALGDHRFRERQAAMLAPGPRLNWTSGTYGAEHNADGAEFVWSRAESFAEIRNFGSGKWHGHLNFRAAAGREGRLAVTVGAQEVSGDVGPVPRPFSLPVTLEAGGAVAVHFAGTMGRIDLPPGETRDLHFYVMDIGLDHQNQ